MNTTLLTCLLSRVFGVPEEINGGERCPTYLYRWALLPTWLSRRLGKRNVYLHRFVGDDWALDLHDHPKRFVSIGLWGSYVEHLPSIWTAPHPLPNVLACGCSRHKVEAGLCDLFSPRRRVYRAPWIRTFRATHTHRLTGPTPERPCWTLVVVLREERAWGFWNLGVFIPWKRYVNSSLADERKACS